MAFSSKDRQKIIDEYLASTGRNMFIPSEFVDWLGGDPEHEAYDWFYGQGDEEAARQHRISMARRMANGLRIRVATSEAPSRSEQVSVEVREYPALVSPIASRKQGGGYVPFSPNDPAIVGELRNQASQALQSWLDRYRGSAKDAGVDVMPIEEIVTQLKCDVVGAA